MLDSFNELISKNSFFWFCAMAGSGFFLTQFVLSFCGSEVEGDNESGKFKWLLKQALTGFLMMFGWAGLTCEKQFGLALIPSLVLAVAAGLVSGFVTVLIFKGAQKLRSTGDVFRIDDAIGKEATIYQRISQNGVGKISICLNNFTHEIDAISDQAADLPSFTKVHIIKKADEKTVVVVPIQ